MRMMVASVLLLAGCAARPSTPAVPDSPEVAACRVEARNDPQRRSLLQRRVTGNPVEIDRMVEEAEQAAVAACLRQRGGIEEGGVERVRR